MSLNFIKSVDVFFRCDDEWRTGDSKKKEESKKMNFYLQLKGKKKRKQIM